MNSSRFMRLSVFRILVMPVLLLLLGTAAQVSAQDGNQGAQIYDRNCAACHGTDGNGSDRGVAIATPPSIVAMSDADLIKIVRDGTAAGMPPFSRSSATPASPLWSRTCARCRARPRAVGRGLPPAAVNGNPANGRDLFFGNARVPANATWLQARAACSVQT